MTIAAPPAPPTVYELGADADRPPPTTRAEAERLGPYEQLRQLRHVSVARQTLRLWPTVEQLLGELALSSAVQHTWLRLQPLTMHRALVRGATMAQVAAAVGAGEAACAQAWLRWAQQQAAYAQRTGQPALAGADQVDAIVARHPELWPEGAR